MYFGYCESATGIGLMAGPIVGQVFYSSFGFSGCFYSTTVLLLGAGYISYKYINQSNKSRKSDEIMDIEGDDGVDAEGESEMAFFLRALRSQGVLMPIVSCILGTIFLLFNEPIISDHLIQMGMSPDYNGFTFAASCLCYAIAAPIVGYLTKHFSKESLTLFAYVFSSLALLIQGPSKLLGLPETSIHLTLSGFIILGAMEAFIFVPLMPILIEALLKEE